MVKAMATHLQELEAYVKALREENERLRTTLDAECERRQALEDELAAVSDTSIWSRIWELVEW